MGAGSTLTAVNTTAALVTLKPRIAFSIGPAGSLTEKTSPGIIYRINESVAWQRGSFNDSGFALASTARAALPVPFSHPWLDSLPATILAGGEVFVASESGRDQVQAVSRSELVDMNTAGLVAACAARKTPLVVVRIVSDRANPSASEDFSAFTTRYEGALARSLVACIRELPLDPLNLDQHANLSKWLAEPTEQNEPSEKEPAASE